jgi:hypothetical protein
MVVLVNVFFLKSLSPTSYIKVSAHIAKLNQTKVTCILTVIFVLFNKWGRSLGASSIQTQAMLIISNFYVVISMLKESFLAMIYSVL